VYDRKWLFVVAPILLLAANFGVAFRIFVLRLSSNGTAKITDPDFAVFLATWIVLTLLLNITCTGAFLNM
jgi:hypothetical protein